MRLVEAEQVADNSNHGCVGAAFSLTFDAFTLIIRQFKTRSIGSILTYCHCHIVMACDVKQLSCMLILTDQQLY